MTKKNEVSLLVQRDKLRSQLQAQRLLIAKQMSNSSCDSEDASHAKAYPRSMTMRFLSQQPVTRLLVEFATFLAGARLLKSITSAVTISRMVQAAVTGRN